MGVKVGFQPFRTWVKFQDRSRGQVSRSDMGQGLVGVGFRDGGQDRVSGLDRDQVLGQELGFRVEIGFRMGVMFGF